MPLGEVILVLQQTRRPVTRPSRGIVQTRTIRQFNCHCGTPVLHGRTCYKCCTLHADLPL